LRSLIIRIRRLDHEEGKREQRARKILIEGSADPPNLAEVVSRVKVQACGVCHSDALTKDGIWPGIAYPRSPGHEIAGIVYALGPDTVPWKIGDRVGVGWYGGNRGRRDSCRRGDFITCVKLQVRGTSYDRRVF
jgi:D-arabinose 1-dehydrogenase-like Zn-dependent alcohol dehydrogenase